MLVILGCVWDAWGGEIGLSAMTNGILQAIDKHYPLDAQTRGDTNHNDGVQPAPAFGSWEVVDLHRSTNVSMQQNPHGLHITSVVYCMLLGGIMTSDLGRPNFSFPFSLLCARLRPPQ